MLKLLGKKKPKDLIKFKKLKILKNEKIILKINFILFFERKKKENLNNFL